MNQLTIFLALLLLSTVSATTCTIGFHTYPQNADLQLNQTIDARTYTALQVNGKVYPVFGLALCKGKVEQINTTTRPYSITVDSIVFLLQETSHFQVDYINGAAFGIDTLTNQDFTSVFEHLFALNLPFTFKMPQNSLITLKKQFYIYTSNTILDFQNSTIEWKADGIKGTRRELAIFMFRGTTEYESPSKVPIRISPSFNQPSYSYIEFPETPIELFTSEFISFKTTRAHKMWNKPEPIIDRHPVYSGLYEILEKTPIENNHGTKIKVYGNFPWHLDYTSSLRMILPNKDSGIKNVHIKNTMRYDHIEKSKNRATTGVNFQSTLNNFAENINGSYFFNPLVTVYSSALYTISNGYNIDPLNTDSGRGYFVQIGDCQNCHAQNLKAKGNRHIVDFTGCQNCSAKNCEAENEKDTSYSLHGQWEYDILVKNCTGSVGIAISSTRHWNFGDMAQNVTIDTVKGKKLLNYRKAQNITILNSEFELSHTNDFDFRFENSQITKYIRFQNVSFHHYLENVQQKSAFAVNSTIKCEPFDKPGKKPKCIEEGAIVELIDSVFDIRTVNNKGSANNPAARLVMKGGQILGGARSVSFRGKWTLNQVEFVNTTLELNKNTVGGSELQLLGCFQRPETSGAGGAIVNKIPKEGAIDPETGAHSRNTYFTLVINGGDWAVKAGQGKIQTVLDLGWPYKSLHLMVMQPNILSGVVKGNLRYRIPETGNIFYKLGTVGEDTKISVLN